MSIYGATVDRFSKRFELTLPRDVATRDIERWREPVGYFNHQIEVLDAKKRCIYLAKIPLEFVALIDGGFALLGIAADLLTLSSINSLHMWADKELVTLLRMPRVIVDDIFSSICLNEVIRKETVGLRYQFSQRHISDRVLPSKNGGLTYEDSSKLKKWTWDLVVAFEDVLTLPGNLSYNVLLSGIVASLNLIETVFHLLSWELSEGIDSLRESVTPLFEIPLLLRETIIRISRLLSCMVPVYHLKDTARTSTYIFDLSSQRPREFCEKIYGIPNGSEIDSIPIAKRKEILYSSSETLSDGEIEKMSFEEEEGVQRKISGILYKALYDRDISLHTPEYLWKICEESFFEDELKAFLKMGSLKKASELNGKKMVLPSFIIRQGLLQLAIKTGNENLLGLIRSALWEKEIEEVNDIENRDKRNEVFQVIDPVPARVIDLLIGALRILNFLPSERFRYENLVPKNIEIWKQFLDMAKKHVKDPDSETNLQRAIWASSISYIQSNINDEEKVSQMLNMLHDHFVSANGIEEKKMANEISFLLESLLPATIQSMDKKVIEKVKSYIHEKLHGLNWSNEVISKRTNEKYQEFNMLKFWSGVSAREQAVKFPYRKKEVQLFYEIISDLFFEPSVSGAEVEIGADPIEPKSLYQKVSPIRSKQFLEWLQPRLAGTKTGEKYSQYFKQNQ